MSKPFTGLCIGGPLDGKMWASETPTMKVTLPLPPTVIGGDAISMALSVQQVFYVHDVFMVNETADRATFPIAFGYWRLRHESALDVMRQLFEHYQTRARR